MEGSGLRHRQINERMARLVDQFEICVTMAWYGMVTNGIALTFHVPRTSMTASPDNRRVMSANSPDIWGESPMGKSRRLYFPPNSPDRNPDEPVWKHLKADAAGRMLPKKSGR
jgi:hypothetical protein